MSVNALAMDTPIDYESLSPLYGDLAALRSRRFIVGTSVMFTDLDDAYQLARFRSGLESTENYASCDVPKIVMCDPRSDERVSKEHADRGAIVFSTPRPGLATPYLDIARLVQVHAHPEAALLKAEDDKLITAQDLREFQRFLIDFDVIVGDRTDASRASMHPVQQWTEGVLDFMLSQLGMPRGISGGVQAYSQQGLQIFLEYEKYLDLLGNNWKYLLFAPLLASRRALQVTHMQLNLHYPENMVRLEGSLPAILKRLEQLLLMLEGGVEIPELVYGSQAFGSTVYHMSSERMVEAKNALEALRTAVTALGAAA